MQPSSLYDKNSEIVVGDGVLEVSKDLSTIYPNTVNIPIDLSICYADCGGTKTKLRRGFLDSGKENPNIWSKSNEEAQGNYYISNCNYEAADDVFEPKFSLAFFNDNNNKTMNRYYGYNDLATSPQGGVSQNGFIRELNMSKLVFGANILKAYLVEEVEEYFNNFKEVYQYTSSSDMPAAPTT